MAVDIVFETHSLTEDNEAGIATGWLPGRLSAAGREQAAMLGERRRHGGLAAVFTSDLERALETTRIAFAGSSVPILSDWRLRECDYGTLNGAPVAEVHGDRAAHLERALETTRIAFAGSSVPILSDWRERTVLVVGHVATRWGLDCALGGARLADLVAEEFAWQPGWRYRLE